MDDDFSYHDAEITYQLYDRPSDIWFSFNTEVSRNWGISGQQLFFLIEPER